MQKEANSFYSYAIKLIGSVILYLYKNTAYKDCFCVLNLTRNK